MIDDERVDLNRTQRRAHAWRPGHGRTAECSGVSRQTLWRFLERDQVGRARPRTVLDSASGSVEALEAAARTLIDEPPSRSRTPPIPSFSCELHDALLRLCEAPLTTARELARLRGVPLSTRRGQLVKLTDRTGSMREDRALIAATSPPTPASKEWAWTAMDRFRSTLF